MHSAHLIEQIVDASDPTSGFARVERGFELLGLFVFAISGAMLAVRKGFELVGIVSLATITALGGGVVRDLVLGDTPPLAFRDTWYLVIPLVAAAIVFVAHGPIERHLHRPVLVFDAIGLGLFSVTGAVKAASYPDTTAIGAVVLAVVTAVGGGIMRDVLANDPPQLFQPDSRLYAIPAAVGATILVVLIRNDVYSSVAALLIAAGVCLARLAALRWGWRAPMPRPARR